MKRTVLTASFAVLLLASARGATWEGSAMMSSYGDFPPSGYYAACNSFQRNTAVEVLNLETGKSVTVIVTRSVDNAGVFMVLSPEAALAIGIQPGVLSRVRVTTPQSASSLAPSAAGASTETVDPDFNPKLYAKRPAVSSPQVEPAKTAPDAMTKPPEGVAEGSPASSGTTETTKPAGSPETPPDGTKRPTEAAKAPEKPDSIQRKEPSQLNQTPSSQSLVEPPVRQAKAANDQATTQPPKTSEKPPLPVPDEAPIKPVAPSVPAKYATPENRPDVLDLRRPQNRRGTGIEASLRDPSATAEERATPYSRTTPETRHRASVAELHDPETRYEDETPRAETDEKPGRSVAVYAGELDSPGTMADESPRTVTDDRPGRDSELAGYRDSLDVPDLKDDRPVAVGYERPERGSMERESELTEPSMVPDELPEMVIANMTRPDIGVPELDLAEGEIELEEGVRDMIAYDRSPTRYSQATERDLDDAALVPEETPAVLEGSPDRAVAVQERELDDAELSAEETPAVLEGSPARAARTDERELDDATLAPEEAPAVINGDKPVPQRQASAAPGLRDPEVAATKPAVAAGAAGPEKGPVDAALEPSGANPPPASGKPGAVSAAAATAKPAPETTKSRVVPIARLEKGKHYIQLGAYKTMVALDIAGVSVDPAFKLAVETVKTASGPVYRLYVGPLSRDESGVVLLRLKSAGFKDAFVRVGE
ncbi:MAG: hypothetical protein NT080_13560 [Spirochaetes bacterium]|nr:hypothetical protein [Spirochaetota bacterium]